MIQVRKEKQRGSPFGDPLYSIQRERERSEWQVWRHHLTWWCSGRAEGRGASRRSVEGRKGTCVRVRGDDAHEAGAQQTDSHKGQRECSEVQCSEEEIAHAQCPQKRLQCLSIYRISHRYPPDITLVSPENILGIDRNA